MTVFEKLFSYNFNIKNIRSYLCDDFEHDFIIHTGNVDYNDLYRCTIEMV